MEEAWEKVHNKMCTAREVFLDQASELPNREWFLLMHMTLLSRGDVELYRLHPVVVLRKRRGVLPGSLDSPCAPCAVTNCMYLVQ